ncbi:MAG: glycosyltransferase family 4 protein [Planctomycetaceae bacterium]
MGNLCILSFFKLFGYLIEDHFRHADRNIENVMLRVLYFHHAVGPGGAPRSLSYLIGSLDPSQVESVVVVPDRPGNEAVCSLFRNAGATVVTERNIRPFDGSTVSPCRGLRGKAYAFYGYNSTCTASRSLVRHWQPDIVHLNSTCLAAAAKGARQANPRVPVITHVREPLLPNLWGRMLAATVRRYTNCFISIDAVGLESLLLPPNCLAHVIPNFVDESRYVSSVETRSRFRRTLGWSDTDVVVLSLSRVSESNGALEFARLIKACHGQLPEQVRFGFAGFSSEPRPYAREAAELLQILPRCQTIPFTDDVVSLLNAADVVVAPFVTSHSARSVIEGAMMGKPALVTELPNLMEQIVVGQTGLTFSLSDEAKFVSALRCFCDPSNLGRMSQNAEEFGRRRFGQIANTARVLDIYRDMVRSRRFAA